MTVVTKIEEGTPGWFLDCVVEWFDCIERYYNRRRGDMSPKDIVISTRALVGFMKGAPYDADKHRIGTEYKDGTLFVVYECPVVGRVTISADIKIDEKDLASGLILHSEAAQRAILQFVARKRASKAIEKCSWISNFVDASYYSAKTWADKDETEDAESE